MSRPGRAAHEHRLSKGRRIRRKMSAELRALKNGDMYIEDALRDPSDALGRCKVYDVLCHTPGLGEVTARNILERLDVWPLEQLEKLTPEERGELATALPERALRS